MQKGLFEGEKNSLFAGAKKPISMCKTAYMQVQKTVEKTPISRCKKRLFAAVAVALDEASGDNAGERNGGDSMLVVVWQQETKKATQGTKDRWGVGARLSWIVYRGGARARWEVWARLSWVAHGGRATSLAVGGDHSGGDSVLVVIWQIE